ncbi:MAG: indoleamine 2,3-dioxygenase, partial [Phycisphaerales bacterium]|nr:indoleamine 2,3-dioxygenase [Phycisphaerales bacterium]
MDDSITSRLLLHDVDPERGFLPASDPLRLLPDDFAPWEHLAIDLPALVATQQVREAILNLPALETHTLTSEPELRRAMLLLSVFASACVWSRSQPLTSLPENLCRPWADVASKLDRPMIIAHASIVLHNWRRIDPTGPMSPDNLRALACFRGGPDEEWFYLVTVAIEACGARALPALLAAQDAAGTNDHNGLLTAMKVITETIDEMTMELVRMEERCSHAVFYHRVRPFLTGWPEPGLVYEGINEDPVVLHGGSAAQSSLLNSLDAALDVPHEHPGTKPFLQAMRKYMPPRHRKFIEHLEAGPSVRDAAAAQSDTRTAFDRCIDA